MLEQATATLDHRDQGWCLWRPILGVPKDRPDRGSRPGHIRWSLSVPELTPDLYTWLWHDAMGVDL